MSMDDIVDVVLLLWKSELVASDYYSPTLRFKKGLDLLVPMTIHTPSTVRALIAQLEEKWPSDAVEKNTNSEENKILLNFAWKSKGGNKVAPDIPSERASSGHDSATINIGKQLLESIPTSSGLLFDPIESSYDFKTARFWIGFVKAQCHQNASSLKGILNTSVFVAGKLASNVGEIGARSVSSKPASRGTSVCDGNLNIVTEDVSGIARSVSCSVLHVMRFEQYSMLPESQLSDSPASTATTAAVLSPRGRMKTSPELHEYVAIQPLHFHNSDSSSCASTRAAVGGAQRLLPAQLFFLCQVLEKEVCVSALSSTASNYMLKVKLLSCARDASGDSAQSDNVVMTIHSSYYAIYNLHNRVPAVCAGVHTNNQSQSQGHIYGKLWLANSCLDLYCSGGGSSAVILPGACGGAGVSTTNGNICAPRWCRLITKATDMLRTHWSGIISHSLAVAAGNRKGKSGADAVKCVTFCMNVLETILTFQLRPLVRVVDFYHNNSDIKSSVSSLQQKQQSPLIKGVPGGSGGGSGGSMGTEVGRLFTEYIVLFQELCYLPVLTAISGYGAAKCAGRCTTPTMSSDVSPAVSPARGRSDPINGSVGGENSPGPSINSSGRAAASLKKAPSLRERMNMTAEAIKGLSTSQNGGLNNDSVMENNITGRFDNNTPSTPKKNRVAPVFTSVPSVINRLNMIELVAVSVQAYQIHAFSNNILADLPAPLKLMLDKTAVVVSVRGRVEVCYGVLIDRIVALWRDQLQQNMKNDIKPDEWNGTVIFRRNTSFTLGIQAIVLQLCRFVRQLTSTHINIKAQDSAEKGSTVALVRSNSSALPLLIATRLVNTCLHEVILHTYGNLNTSRTKVCQWYRDVMLVLVQSVRFYREIESAAARICCNGCHSTRNSNVSNRLMSFDHAELAIARLFGAAFTSLDAQQNNCIENKDKDKDKNKDKDTIQFLVQLLKSLSASVTDAQHPSQMTAVSSEQRSSSSDKQNPQVNMDSNVTVDSCVPGNPRLKKDLREGFLLMELSAVMLMYRCAPVYTAMGAIQISKKLPSIFPPEARENVASGVYCILGELGNDASAGSGTEGAVSPTTTTTSEYETTTTADLIHPALAVFGCFNPADASADPNNNSRPVSISTVCELLLTVCSVVTDDPAGTPEIDELAVDCQQTSLEYFNSFFKLTDVSLVKSLDYFTPFPKYAPLNDSGVLATVKLLSRVSSLVHVRFSLEHIMWRQLRNRYELIPHTREMSLARSHSSTPAPICGTKEEPIGDINATATNTVAAVGESDFTSGKIFPLVSAEEEERCAELLSAIIDWYVAVDPPTPVSDVVAVVPSRQQENMGMAPSDAEPDVNVEVVAFESP